MNSTSNTVPVIQILQEAGLIAADREFFAREKPRNHERRADSLRQQYVIYAGSEIHAHLTIGADLGQLRERVSLFQKTYPAFGNQVLGYTSREGIDYLLETHFEGRPALDLIGQIDGTEKIISILKEIETAFDGACHLSTHQAAQDELDSFFAEVSSLPHWTAVDRVFLREIVHPYLQTQLLKERVVHRRVTNGDFLMRNLLVNDAGEFRIIDCEFATDTHFYQEDWLRFGYWDALPEGLAQFVKQQLRNYEPWGVYFCLKQLILESRSNLPQKVNEDTSQWSREICRLMERRGALAKQSFFWPATGQAALEEGFEAQLYWLTDDGWKENASARVPVETGRSLHLVFDLPSDIAVHGLRFDPMNGAGAATIHSLKVVTTGVEEKIVWLGTNPRVLQQWAAKGDSILEVNFELGIFRVLSVGTDPQLFLKEVGKAAGQGMRVEVTLTYSTDPADQILSARRYIQTHLSQSEVISDLARTPVISGQKLAAFNPLLQKTEGDVLELSTSQQSSRHPLQAETTNQITALASRLEVALNSHRNALAELSAKILEQKSIEKKLADTQTRLDLLQGVLPEYKKQLAFAHEALKGHAQTIDRLEQARDALQQDLHTTHANASNQIGHLRMVEDNNGRLAQELAAAREQVVGLNEQVKINRQAHDRLAENLSMLKNIFESETGPKRQLADTDEALRTATASILQLEIELNAERTHRRQLEASRFWRWTSWLRPASGGTLPLGK